MLTVLLQGRTVLLQARTLLLQGGTVLLQGRTVLLQGFRAPCYLAVAACAGSETPLAKPQGKGQAAWARYVCRREQDTLFRRRVVWLMGSCMAFDLATIFAASVSMQVSSCGIGGFLQSTAVLLIAVFVSTLPMHAEDECTLFTPRLPTLGHKAGSGVSFLPLFWLLEWWLPSWSEPV